MSRVLRRPIPCRSTTWRRRSAPRWGEAPRPSSPFQPRRGRGEERIEPFLDRRITFARCLFEAAAITDLHRASPIADEARGLQRLSGQRYRLAVDAQYVRQKVVSISQGFALGPIMHHEEPAGHPLLHRVQRIARHGLLDLRHQGLRITDEEVPYMFAPPEFFLHYLDRASDHGPLHLHDASIERAFVHGSEKPECSFAPYVRGLDCRTI